MGLSRKGFYVSPPILIGANSAILLIVGIIFARRELGFWDGISITIGAFLLAMFFIFIYGTRKIKQIHMKPGRVDELITSGPYAVVRHPNYTGAILMNIAFLLFFRTLWLVPVIGFFTWLWYLEAKHEEIELIAKFGIQYKNYARTTGMFFPKLFKPKNIHD